MRLSAARTACCLVVLAVGLAPASAEDIVDPEALLDHEVPEGYMLVEGDIIAPDDLYTDLRGTYAANLWPNGVVPYQFDANVSQTNRNRTLDAMAEWEAVAQIDFIPRNGHPNYIHIQSSTVNSSHVGMVGGGQNLNMVSWSVKFIIVHELGHALGLWHEQSRTDRNQFIQVNTQNVQSGTLHNFNIVSSSSHHGPYDFDSVMHYPRCAFSNCCPAGSTCSCATECQTITVLPPNEAWQNVIGQRNHLSVGDAETAAFLYGPRFDCNNNGVDDLIDIATGTSEDCDGNTTPDECDPDCDNSGTPDACEWDLVIAAHPVHTGVCEFEPAQLFAAAVSPGSATFQWFKDDEPVNDGGGVSGATTATLNVSALQPANEGAYFCEITDGCLVARTDAANLFIVDPAGVAAHPTTLLRQCVGRNASFSIAPSGTAPFSYLWETEGQTVGTSQFLTLSNITHDQAGQYTCTVSNPCGSEQSNAGTLEVAGPLITLHPTGQCVESDGSVQFTADAVAESTIFWGWYKVGSAFPLSDGGNISGALTTTVTIDPVTSNDAGEYVAAPFTLEPQPLAFCVAESEIATLTVGGCPACSNAGDADGDGDVDLRDMHQFMLCFGEVEPLPEDCACSKVNASSSEIDLDDWLMLAPLITGP